MSKWTKILAIILILGASPLLAGEATWIPFSADESAEIAIEAARSSEANLDFDLVVPGLSLRADERAEGAFTRVTVPGMGELGEPGEPLLPVLRRFVEIPQGAKAKVQVDVLETEVVDLARCGLPTTLMPAQLSLPKCDNEEYRSWRFSYDPKAYRGTVAPDRVALSQPVTIRDHRMVLATIAPITYDAEAGLLEVATRTRVQITFEEADLTFTRAVKDRLSSRAFDAFLSGATVNLNLGGRAAGWGYPGAAPVEFLIITPPQFVTALEPFVEWKTSTGYQVTVATTGVTGTTTAAIKTYITGLYNGSNPPVYILMIGDSPSPLVTQSVSGGGSGGTDLPYVQMDGDLYPDMMIARWPIDDETELVNMRDKILHYEQPTAANSAWLNRALFLAGDDYMGRVTTHEEVRAELMDPPPNSAETEQWWGDTENPTTQQLINDLNTGRGWAVYSAHSGPGGWSGDPPLSSSDMPNFGNTDMYPISHGHSCSSNEWNAYDDVFGEAAVTQANKGFVSYWGGSASTYWDGDDWLEKGFFDSLVEADMASNAGSWDGHFSNVAANYAGLTEVTLWGGGSAGEHYYWHCYNLDGDPTLDPFTRAPAALNVGAPPAISPSATDSFTVTVTDSGSAGVSGALVAASQNDTLLGAGYTDATGDAVFHIDAPSAGNNILVRVTAHNFLPTDATVMVGADDDGVVTLDAVLYPCGATVVVDVFDANASAPLSVTLQTSGTNSTAVAMTAMGDVTGHYQGSVVLGSGLPAGHGDTLTVLYLDEDTGSTTNVTKTDTAMVDCAGPAITDVHAATVEWDGAELVFATDEQAVGTLRYGTSCASLSETLTGGATTSHSFRVSGLPPLTEYFYDVAATDAVGNTTADNNGGSCYSFSTLEEPIFFTELFDASDNDLEGLSMRFSPNGSGSYYGACVSPITDLPVDPTGGTAISLSDDDAEQVSPAAGPVSFYGTDYPSFWVGSNGYITFDQSDTDYSESLEEHFGQVRISALYDDLNPSSGGTVSWLELADKVVVTWDGVHEYSSGNLNTFQVELHADGTLVLSYVEVNVSDGLAGLSEGNGLDPDFEETDLSAFEDCTGMMFKSAFETGNCGEWDIFVN